MEQRRRLGWLPAAAAPLVMTLVLSGCGGRPDQGAEQQAAPGADTKGLTVAAREFSFEPSTIEVDRGKNVRITLKNEGSVEHDFAVPDLDFTITQVPPGQEKTGTFYAAKSGTFDIVCTVPGHKEAGMVGKLKVR